MSAITRRSITKPFPTKVCIFHTHTNMTLSLETLGSCNLATCRDDVNISAWMLKSEKC